MVAIPSEGCCATRRATFYGTATGGGAANAGVVYKLDVAGQQTVLYNFAGGADGSGPAGAVVRDAAGNLYGAAEHGGTGNCFAGCGVVFRLNTVGQETVLYNFSGTGGAYPMTGVIRDSAGNLYGTANSGGTSEQGVVFEVNAAGQGSVLYNFTGKTDGGEPFAGVTRDSAGNLYGTTEFGGASGLGVVYKLDTAGVETVLYSFTGQSDGGTPYAGVIRDSAGNLYGTTYLGGTAGRGIRAEYGWRGNGPVQLHGRSGWRQALCRGDRGPGRQFLRDCLCGWERIKRRGVQTHAVRRVP